MQFATVAANADPNLRILAIIYHCVRLRQLLLQTHSAETAIYARAIASLFACASFAQTACCPR